MLENIFFILHSFVNIFAGGRSNIKPILFFLYCVILFLIYFLFKNIKLKLFKWKYFFTCIILLYIYGFFLNYVYIKSLGLSLNDFIITGNNYEISSTSFSHAHILKGSIAWFISMFRNSNMDKLDAGGAFLGLVPNILFAIGAIFLVILLIKSILYFTIYIEEYFKNKNTRQKIFLIIFYSILSFSIIKTSIDGGILSPYLIVGIIFILFFYLRSSNKISKNYYLFGVLISIIVTLFSINISSYIDGNGIFLASISSITILYICIMYGLEENFSINRFIILVLLFLSIWYVYSERDIVIYNYQKSIIKKGDWVITYNKENNTIEQKKNMDETRVYNIAVDLNKNITYMPVTIPGVTCSIRSPFNLIKTLLISKTDIKNLYFKQNQFLYIKVIDSTSKDKLVYSNIEIYINECTPEPLTVIDGIFKSNGIDTYFLINPRLKDGTYIN